MRVGPYEILEKIGAGGMGTVYRARNIETGKIVALKVMRAEFAEDASYIRRFKREASIASSLDSPNIVSFFDVGQQDESPYIAMELIEGQPLNSLIRSSGPLSVDQALDIAIQVAQALYAAAEKGVIHRDVSPQNILITSDGTAKITDFGIARVESSATLTGTGTFIGKPSYAPPEVFEGQADARSDIYSLGIVLFEMLSGRPPFVASNPLSTMDMQMRQAPPKLQDLGVRVPPAVQQVIDKCLQKNPAQRFQTPRDLLLALTRALQGQPVDDLTQVLSVGAGSGIPPARVAPPGSSGGRWPLLLLAAGVISTGAVALIVAAVVLTGRSAGNPQSNPGPNVANPAGTPTSLVAVTPIATPAPTPTVAVFVIPVCPSNGGNPSPCIRAAGDVQIPSVVQANQPFAVSVTALNQGSDAPMGAITVSSPDAISARTSYSSDPAQTPSAAPHEAMTSCAGWSSQTDRCAAFTRGTATYPLTEAYEIPWRSGQPLTMRTELTPLPGVSKVRVNIRVSLKSNDSGDWFVYPVIPEASIPDDGRAHVTLDQQQQFPILQYTIAVSG